MTRCEFCREAFTASKPNARFCKQACRQAAFNERKRQVENVGPTLRAVAAPIEAIASTSVRERTLARLEVAGRADTDIAAVALALAARIDRGADTGSAMATCAKQLSVTMAEALKGADLEASHVSSLRERRDAKRA